MDIGLQELYQLIQLAPAITTCLPEEIGKGEITRIRTNNGYQASSFWISTFMGIRNVSTAGIVLAAGCLGGIPFLVIAYNRIYRKYKRRGI